MSRILISYRREDTAGHAGRLYDLLVERFGPDRIFMDVDTISPGDDFVEVIRSAVTSSDVLIALIGREWLIVEHPSGHRRLDDPDDFVALELATALEGGVRVVPVLVQGAAMPAAEALPLRLRALARRNAVEISDTRFRRDAAALIDSLRRILEGRGPRRWPRLLPTAGVAALAIAALAAGGLGYRVWTRLGPATGPGTAERVASAPAPAIHETTATSSGRAEGERMVAAGSEPVPAPTPGTAGPSATTVPTREPAPKERPRPAAPHDALSSPAPPVATSSANPGRARVVVPATPGPPRETPSAPAAAAPPRPEAPSARAPAPSPPVVASLPPATAPRLIAPSLGASVPQASIRAWTFRWAAPASGGPVERYHLVVQGPGASWPAADVTTSETSWTMPARGECSYVPEHGRTGWQWKVRAQREGGTWSEWSTGRFDVELVDRDSYCRRCPGASICAR